MQVTASETKATRVEIRNLFSLQGGQTWIRQAGTIGGPSVFNRLGHGRTNLPDHGKFNRQGLIGTFHYDHAFNACKHVRNEIGREWTVHHHINDADLQPAFFTQVICNNFGITNNRTLSEDDIFGIFHFVTHHTTVFTPGQGFVLLECLVGQVGNMIKIERTLCCDTLGIGILILDGTQHCGVIKVV